MAVSSKKKRNIGIVVALVLVIVASAFAATRGKGKDEPESDIRTEKAEIADVQVKVTEVGTVEPEVKVEVKSAVSGKVVDIFVRDGDVVERGQLLARVEPDLNQAQSLSETKNSLRSAEIAYQQAQRDLESDRSLFSQGLLAPTSHRESETRYLSAKQQYESALEKYRLVEQSGIPIGRSAANFGGSNVSSPMRGLVLTRDVEIGETVTSGVSSFNAGTVLFTVADVSSMIVKAGVNEVDIAKIHAGQPVKVTLDAFPKVHFPARISRIAPAVRVDDKVRVFDVEIRLDAQGKELRSGMTANIEVAGEKKTKVLTVPVESVFLRDDGEIVYVKKKLTPEQIEALGEKKADPKDRDAWKALFDKRVVITGLSDNSRVEIVRGLRAGEEVALEDPTLPADKKQDDED
jgi:HlyD family secretion protein